MSNKYSFKELQPQYFPSIYKINNDELNEINQRSLGLTPNAVLRIDF